MFVPDNRIGTVLDYYRQGLAELYEPREIEQIAYLCFEFDLGFSKIDLVLRKEETLSESQLLSLHWKLKALKKGKPVQQVLGVADFMGLKFRVNEHVLSPRQETEELVQWVLDENPQPGLRVLDVGTGSGCIAIALAVGLTEATITALDVSEEALMVARENAGLNKVQIEFSCSDILNEQPEFAQLDVVVSNPPYVLFEAKYSLHRNVVEHEPHIALFVPDNDPLLFYRRIAGLAKNWLRPGGKLYFECNENMGSELVSLLGSLQYTNVELRKDLVGNDRMVRCEKP